MKETRCHACSSDDRVADRGAWGWLCEPCWVICKDMFR